MWSKPSVFPFLQQDAIHIWRASLDVDASSLDLFWQTLSKDEQEKANRYHFVKDRNHYIAGRGILRQLLGNYLNLAAGDLLFDYNKFGKPTLVGDQSLQFNLSHSKAIALFSFTHDLDLGIDVEWVDPGIEVISLANNFFSKKEAETLLSLPQELITEAFFNCWTRKEAIVKAIGEGLSFPLDQFEVSLKPAASAQLKATYWDDAEANAWTLSSMEPAADYKAAIAYRAKPMAQAYFDFPA